MVYTEHHHRQHRERYTQNPQFAVATKETMRNGNDRWESHPIDRDTAITILIHNGWTEAEAEQSLIEMNNREEFILVNTRTQIC